MAPRSKTKPTVLKALYDRWSGSLFKGYLVMFCEKSGIHGFFYFAQSNLMALEKLFWLLLIISAFYACAVLSLQSWDRYKNKSTVIAVEKDYYYWNTTLPSLTICPQEERINRSLLYQYCATVYPNLSEVERNEFFVFLESLANATYSNFEDIQEFEVVEKLNIDPKTYMALISNVTEDWSRRSVESFKVISMFDSIFCQTEQVLTEMGICYSTNNYLAKDLATRHSNLIFSEEPLPISFDEFFDDVETVEILQNNRFKAEMTYSFVGFNYGFNAVFSHYSIFLHSPWDSINIQRQYILADIGVTIRCMGFEIVADEDLYEETSIHQRRCRFNDESNLTHYEIYTEMLCLQECRMNLAYELCKCIPHFYPNNIAKPKRVCSYKELKQCIAPKKDILIELREHTGRFDCNCEENCLDLDITFDIQLQESSSYRSSGATVLYADYPLVRYRRKIMFSFEDLLVSIGGTAGLFTGFCVLGAFDIVYFFTLRLFWYFHGRR